MRSLINYAIRTSQSPQTDQHNYRLSAEHRLLWYPVYQVNLVNSWSLKYQRAFIFLAQAEPEPCIWSLNELKPVKVEIIQPRPFMQSFFHPALNHVIVGIKKLGLGQAWALFGESLYFKPGFLNPSPGSLHSKFREAEDETESIKTGLMASDKKRENCQLSNPSNENKKTKRMPRPNFFLLINYSSCLFERDNLVGLSGICR